MKKRYSAERTDRKVNVFGFAFHQSVVYLGQHIVLNAVYQLCVAFDGRNSAVCGIAELYKGAVSGILSKLCKTFVYRIVYKAHSYRSRIVFAHVHYIRSYHKLQHSGKA